VQLEKGIKKSLQRLEVQKQKKKMASEEVVGQPNNSSNGAPSTREEGQMSSLSDLSFESLRSAWNTCISVLAEKEDTTQYGEDWHVARQHALQNSFFGFSALTVVSVVRRLVFKI